MSEPPIRRNDEEPGNNPGLSSSEPEANAETLPLNTTTTPDEPVKGAAVTPSGPPSVAGRSLAATQIDPSMQDGGYAPTMGAPTGVDQTLDFVLKEVRRKATAILHTKVGDYEIERELGRGGMGVVYKARHRQLRRDVALKMILAGKHAGPDQLERFLTEARSVAQLQHPNIVQIFDIGEQDGLPYFSLEFVDGRSLAQAINKQPQDPREAAQTIEVLARTMQYAHDHGVLHRDLKPANVLLNKEGVSKISDFGLAKKVADDESESENTRTGTVMGTPSYMSPEQASGLTHDVGPAADQYSLGAMLYEMLTGRPPFLAAKPFDTILQVIHDEPVPPKQLQPGTPVDIETICLKALQKDVGKRYASCTELADDLNRFLKGEPIIARPVGALERAWRWCRRNPRVAIPSAVAVALLLAVTVVSSWSFVTVSHQNVTIKKERDYAQEQEKSAKQSAEAARIAQSVAEVQRKKADESSRVASTQRSLAVDTLYKVVTKVDEKLKDRPDMSDLRKELMTDAMQGLNRVEESDDTRSLVDRSMGLTHQRLADVANQLGNSQEAVDQQLKALAIFKKLLETDPNDDWAKWDAALSYDHLGNLARALKNDIKVAREYYEKALALREELHKGLHIRDPELTPDKVDQALINSYAKLGGMAMAAGEAALARTYIAKTLEQSERLVANDAGNTRARQALAGSYALLGNLSFRLRDVAAAQKYYDQALSIRQKLVDESPQSLKANLDLAGNLGQRGDLLLQLLQRPDAAVPDYEKARQICQSLHERDAKDAQVRDLLAASQHRLGTAQLLLGQTPSAQANFREAVGLRRALAGEDAQNSTKQLVLIQSLARLGEHAEAFRVGESLLPRIGQDHQSLYNLVCGLAICVAVASQPVADSKEDNGQLLAERYANTALMTLKQAVELGYNNLTALETDPDLAAIRSDPRFTQIVAEVKNTKNP